MQATRRITNLDQLLERTTQEGDCRVWIAGRFQNGYGAATFGGRTQRAHRLAWSLANDRLIPDGMVIRHTCDNPPCINPDHLVVGTSKQNRQDMFDRNRQDPNIGKFERTDAMRSNISSAALNRWRNTGADERAAFGAAGGDTRRGKRRGPYKGRSSYTRGYDPVEQAT